MESGKEQFNIKKLFEGFSLINPVVWGKRLINIFWNTVIYGLIIILIMGIGYYSGWNNRPINVKLGYGKEAIIELNANKDYLHITQSGDVFVKNKSGKILKQITIKDIPNLQKALSPFALELKPFVMAGLGSNITGDGAVELGVGVQFARAWRMTLDAFITSYPAIYLGTSYQLTDNCFVGVAIGKSLRDFEETRGILYFKFRF